MTDTTKHEPETKKQGSPSHTLLLIGIFCLLVSLAGFTYRMSEKLETIREGLKPAPTMKEKLVVYQIVGTSSKDIADKYETFVRDDKHLKTVVATAITNTRDGGYVMIVTYTAYVPYSN